MISVEFLGDLLEVLKTMLRNETLSLDAALQCAVTAFQVLKVRGSERRSERRIAMEKAEAKTNREEREKGQKRRKRRGRREAEARIKRKRQKKRKKEAKQRNREEKEKGILRVQRKDSYNNAFTSSSSSYRVKVKR